MVTSGRDFDCPTGAFPNDAILGLYFDCPTGAPTNSDNVVISWLRTNVPKKWLHFNVCHICLHGFSVIATKSAPDTFDSFLAHVQLLCTCVTCV